MCEYDLICVSQMKRQYKKATPFLQLWTFCIISQQKAFERLKLLVSTSRALAYFQNECKTRIVADAGPDGLDAVLLQLHEEE